jgi:hypothetical protein
VAAIIAVAAIFWIRSNEQPTTETAEEVRPDNRNFAVTQTDARVGEYLRKSRVLLVGLSNMDPIQGRPVDLTVEKELSQKLVEEARVLRDVDLVPAQSALMSDLDRILAKVSHAGPESHFPEITTIRDDIQRTNLLFKLRMTESLYADRKIRTVIQNH